MIQWINNIDLINDTEKYEVILLGTNVNCTLGNGLQRKIKKKFPHVDEENMKQPYGDPKRLGTRLTISTNKPIFSLCYITGAQNARPDLQPVFLNYEALEHCLKTANIEFSGMNVASTLMGSSRFDGNGDRERIINLFESNINKFNLTIYDYFQMSRDEENKQQWEELQEIKKNDLNKYKELVAIRKKMWKSTYL